MIEVQQLYSVVRNHLVATHSFVDGVRHFVACVFVTGCNKQIKQVDSQIESEIGFELADDLPQLVQSEHVFFLILQTERKTPHVDPAHMNIDAFFTSGRDFHFKTVLHGLNAQLQFFDNAFYSSNARQFCYLTVDCRKHGVLHDRQL